MYQIRHACHSRLFDSAHLVEPLEGPTPDLAIKCSRCSRKEQRDVIVKYRVKLPRWQAPITPERIYCGNLKCLSRLCDLALPYTLTDSNGDIEIKCHRCREITHIRLGGVAVVD